MPTEKEKSLVVTQKKTLQETLRENMILVGIILFLLGVIISVFVCKIDSLQTSVLNRSEKAPQKPMTVFSHSRVLDFSPVLTAQADKNPDYQNIWGEENLTFNNGGIEVFYPVGSYKPSETPRGGAGFIYHLDSSVTHARLSYDLKFDENFDFVKGGKLPGFCGGTCPRGGSDAIDGFSTRYMWRTDGDIDLYAYLPRKTVTMGESYGRGNFRFVVGQEYRITQELRMNRVGKEDGLLVVYVDGQEVYRNESMVYRETDDLVVDSVLFSTFFGGSDPTWATPVDTKTYFKNFVVEW